MTSVARAAPPQQPSPEPEAEDAHAQHQPRDNKLYLPLGSSASSLSYLHKQPRGYVKSPPIEFLAHSDPEGPPPPIVRKKSGERVKSSLKLPGLVRARSMPNTKNVHFDSRDYIRQFSRTDQPTAVSVDSSPTIEKRRIEFTCGEGTDEDSDGSSSSSCSSSSDEDENMFSRRTEWSIRLTNFTKPTVSLESPNVVLESVSLSSDKERLVGHVLVRNLSYHKCVTVRYTLDYWKTVSEVVAMYNDDIRKRYRNLNYDKFTFTINLHDLPQHALRSKSMFFCIRYNTNGLEFWDNNGRFNYQIDFTRIPKQKQRTKTTNKHSRGRHHHRSLSEPPLDDHDFFLDAAISPDLHPVEASKNTSPTKSKVKKLTSRYNFGASFRNHHHHHHTHDETTDEEETFSFPKTSSHHPSLTDQISRPAWDSSSYQDLLNNYCFFTEKKDLKHNTATTTSKQKNDENDDDDESESDSQVSPTNTTNQNPQIPKPFLPSTKNDILRQIYV